VDEYGHDVVVRPLGDGARIAPTAAIRRATARTAATFQ